MRKQREKKLQNLRKQMKQYNIILASKSPRRRELLAGLGLQFTVKVIPVNAAAPEFIKLTT